MKEHSMKILNRETKMMAMHGCNLRKVKTVTDTEIIAQVSAFKYLGCKISNGDMNVDFGENMAKCNKWNGCIKRNFIRSMRMEIQYLYNTVSKPSLTYGWESWVLQI